MPESGGANIEIAHKLNEVEEKHGAPHSSRWVQMLEILEAIVLASVAIATAWSGYQAARWDGRQDELYENSTKLRVEAQGAQNRGGQEQIYDASSVAEWLKAAAAHDKTLVQVFERRFRPEFRPAFEAWRNTDPLTNPNSPPGPMMMPEYRNADLESAAKLSQEASAMFEEGSKARGTSDDYVHATVLLATVLLLVAISQRFHTHIVRVALATLALVLLCLPLWRILTLPRI
jgi:hypothetical protein